MTDSFTLVAQTRQELGGAACGRLRRLEDKVPAVIYGGGEAPLTIQLDHKKVLKILENHAVYSHTIDLEIDGKKQRAILKQLQRHPYKPRIVHMDFLRITGKEKITVHVPLKFVGENVAVGVKQQGGVISHLVMDVEIQCLPDNLPEEIEVDVSNLGLDHSIHLSQLALPKGVQLVALHKGNDMAVVSIHLPRAQVEEAPATGSEASAAAGESAKEEGEKAKE